MKAKNYKTAGLNLIPPVNIPQIDGKSLSREEIIIKYTPLIKYIAHRLAMRLPPHITADDLIGAGVIGLMDAIEKFDPAKKVQFKTYAEIRIKGAMLDELRSLDWVSRSVRQKATKIEKTYQLLEKKNGRAVEDEEVAQAMSISLEDYYDLLNEIRGVSVLDIESLRPKLSEQREDDIVDLPIESRDNQPFHFFRQLEIKELLSRAIKELPSNERMVIALYYYEQLTLKEIGEVMGYTESRICQLHTKAILKLRSKLKNYKKEFS